MLLASLAAPPPPRREGDVWRLRRGDLLYRFHATFRAEALFDAAGDPRETRDLSAERPGDLAAMRFRFLRALGAGSLREVPARGGDWRKRVEGAGYLGGPGEGGGAGDGGR